MKVPGDWVLIRDRARQIMIDKGVVTAEQAQTTFRLVGDWEYGELLLQKLREEVDEFVSLPSPEEAADVIAVMTAYMALRGFSARDVMEIASRKRRVRGGFMRGWAWLYDPEIAKTDDGFEADEERAKNG